ncbi:MAG TPA: polyhydroxyalkanoate synthesis regulator DNA-binding domain-containing protein [Terriglobales bacterium]|nr:polyhydroxyalkanoate synthesis regulator DNA-binding domain-containing protein [Terriglobales bacterium]
MKTSAIVIRKYGNRRLYDTSTSRYINLDDIAALVRNGKEVQVIDAKTGEDLTRLTLTQIISEDVKNQPSGLPLELLRQLIVATDQVGREFVMWYLKSAFSAYQKVQGALDSGLSEMRSAALSPLETVKNFLQGRTSEPPAASELQLLHARIAELESRLQKPREKPRARSRRRKKR